jgi:uncharacterized protein YeaO (DUF488 family)
MLQYKRVYRAAEASDGRRVLVDRLWPRGLAKDALQLDAWLPQVAPSAALRKAFGHRPEAFENFRSAYRQQLAGHPEHWQQLLHWAASGPLTLLYAAHDEAHNNARVLADFLEDELERHASPSSPVCYRGEFDDG